MIIDEIMHEYCKLEEDHYSSGALMPTEVILSVEAFKKLPFTPLMAFESRTPLNDLRICGLPISIIDTQEFKFKWVFPEKPKQVIVIQP